MGYKRNRIKLVKDLGYEYKVDKITQEDLYSADEAFFTEASNNLMKKLMGMNLVMEKLENYLLKYKVYIMI